MKKICAMGLSFILAFQCFLATVSASGFTTATNDDVVVSAEVVDAITNVLGSIAHEKEFFGFSKNTDMSKVKLGERIPAYIVDNKRKLIESTEVQYYPVFDDENILCTVAAIIHDEEEGILAFLSDEWVDDFCELKSRDAVALLFDKYNAYLWTGNSTVTLGDNGVEDGIAGRSTIDVIDKIEYISIKARALKATINVNKTIMADALNIRSTSANVFVPIKRQGSNQWCWAASMASIVQYEKGINHSCTSMANLYTTDTEEGKSINDVQRYFLLSFSLAYHIRTDGLLSTLLNSLQNDHPVYGSFERNFNGRVVGHAMVIRGIDLTANTFSVMDPNGGSATDSYRTGTITNRISDYGTMSILPYNAASGSTLYYNRGYLYK